MWTFDINILGFWSLHIPTKDVQTPSSPTLSFAPILMEDAQYAETNEKSIFRFLFFELWSILYSKSIEQLTNYEYKNNHISQTKNQKNWKTDFSFVSTHSASFM